MARVRAAITAVFAGLAALFSIGVLVPIFVFGYWYFDNELPLSNLSGRFEQWDESSPNIALILWKGDRNRVCPGKAYRWIDADHAHLVPTVDLPPAGTADKIGHKGILFTVPVPVPPEALRTGKESVTLRVRLVWQCNPLHQYWPLVLDAPDISIPVPTRIR